MISSVHSKSSIQPTSLGLLIYVGVTFQYVINMALKRLEKSLLPYTSESVTETLVRLLYMLTPTNHVKVATESIPNGLISFSPSSK